MVEIVQEVYRLISTNPLTTGFIAIYLFLLCFSTQHTNKETESILAAIKKKMTGRWIVKCDKFTITIIDLSFDQTSSFVQRMSINKSSKAIDVGLSLSESEFTAKWEGIYLVCGLTRFWMHHDNLYMEINKRITAMVAYTDL